MLAHRSIMSCMSQDIADTHMRARTLPTAKKALLVVSQNIENSKRKQLVKIFAMLAICHLFGICKDP